MVGYVTLSGRMGEAANATTTPNGKPVANFTIAVPRGYREKKTNTWIERAPLWVRCVTYTPATVDLLRKYGTKGRKVLIMGTLEHQEYTNSDKAKRISKVYIGPSGNIQFIANDQMADNETSEAASSL